MTIHVTTTRAPLTADRVDANEARIAELTEEVSTLRRALRHLISGQRIGSLAEAILDDSP